MKKSDYHLFEFGDHYFCLLAKNLQLYSLDYEIWTLLNQIKNKEELSFSELKLPENIQKEAIKIFKIIENQKNLRPINILKPISFSINFSQECNLQCSYCYGNKGTYGSDIFYLSQEKIDDFIAFLKNRTKQFKPSAEIHFFGGEPLMNFEGIRYFAESTRKLKIPLTFSMTSNATLITPSIVKFLEEFDFRLTISLDGPEEINNIQRKGKANNFNSAKKTLSGVKMILASDLAENFAIRSTITDETSKRLSEICRYFNEIGTFRYFLSPVSKPDNKPIFEALLNFFNYELKNAITSKNNSGFNKILNIIFFTKRFLTGYRFQRFCNASINYFSFDTELRGYLCHRFIGNKLFLLADTPNGISFAKKENISDVKSGICTNCWALNICGGYGCYFENVVNSGNRHLPSEIVCEYIKKMIEISLINYYFFGNNAVFENSFENYNLF